MQKDKFIPEKFPDGSHKNWGKYDNSARWYPSKALYVEGAFDVRSPSRSWPYSYLHHFYTRKLAKQVAYEKPDVYCQVHNIAKDDPEYAALMAWRVTKKIKEAANAS